MKKLLFTLLFLFFAVNVYGLDRFVDRDSSCTGDNGDTGTPWCSIQAAFTAAAAGHVIKIRDSASCYDENAILTISGTSSNRITVQPDTGHSPCIRHTGSSLTTGAIDIRGNYVTVQNLTFNASGISPDRYALVASAISADITGVIFTGNTVLNWGSAIDRRFVAIGAQVDASTLFWVRNLQITNNTITDGRARGISIGHTDSALIENNTISGLKCGWQSTNNTGAQGIKVGDDGTNNIVRNNKVSSHALDCTGISLGTGTPLFVGLYCDTGPTDTIFEGNEVSELVPGGSASQDGVGIFNESRCHRTIVKRNRVWNIGRYGLRNGSPSTGDPNDTKWQNNTVTGVATGFWLRRGFRAEIRNNILGITSGGTVAIEVHATAIVQGPHTINYNLYYAPAANTKIGRWGDFVTDPFTTWKSDCGCDANSPTPQNPNLVSSTNLTLTSTSPALAAGTALTGIVCNGTCDIGAYESISTPAPTCEVASGAANTIRVTLTNSTAPPIQTGAVTGISTVVAGAVRTPSAPTVVGTNQIYYTISGAAVTGAQAVTWAAASTNTITDSSNAGAPSVAQGLFATGTITCTNNVGGGGPSYVFTQAASQFYSPALVSAALETRPRGAAANADVKPIIGGTVIAGVQIECSGADCPTVALKWQYTLDGGADTDIPDAYGADGIRFHGLTVPSGWATQGQAMTRISGSCKLISGSVQLTSAAVPNISLTNGDCYVVGAMIDFDPAKTLPAAFRLKVVFQAGGAITVTANPDANLIADTASAM